MDIEETDKNWWKTETCFKCGEPKHSSNFWYEYEKFIVPVCPNCFFKEMAIKHNDDYADRILHALTDLGKADCIISIIKDKTASEKND